MALCLPLGASAQTTLEYEIEGLRVVHRLDPEAEIVATRLLLLVDAEGGPGRPGVEGMFLRAATEAVEDRLLEAGARPSVEVARDWSTIGFITLREYWDDAWTIWTSSILDSAVWRTGLDRARSRAVSEARRTEADPARTAVRVARNAAFADHPYAEDRQATSEDLAQLEYEDLSAHRAANMVKSRMLLVIVGDIAREQVELAVSRGLGALPSGAFTRSPPAPPRESENSLQIVNRPMATAFIGGVVIGPPRDSRDAPAFELATYLLASRLAQVVRGERALSYAASATFHDDGIPTATIHVSSPEPAMAYRLVLEQMEWLQTVRELPQWVLSRYLNQFVLGEIAQAMSADAQAEALATAVIHFDDVSRAHQRVEALRTVATRDIQRVALEYFPRFHMAIVGDARLLER